MACEMSQKLPRVNVYSCEFGCIMVTVDVDEGVTPFLIGCRVRSRPDRPLNPKLTKPNGECAGIAQSSFYPDGPLPKRFGEPQWEWFAPTENDIDAEVVRCLSVWADQNPAHLKLEIRQHMRQGGLLLRPRTNREPVYHKTKGAE